MDDNTLKERLAIIHFTELVDFEEGNLSGEDTLRLFSKLVKTGQAWTLQGFYGRTAAGLIDGGFLDRQGNILKQIGDDE